MSLSLPLCLCDSCFLFLSLTPPHLLVLQVVLSELRFHNGPCVLGLRRAEWGTMGPGLNVIVAFVIVVFVGLSAFVFLFFCVCFCRFFDFVVFPCLVFAQGV
jgi:hypothetical protein